MRLYNGMPGPDLGPLTWTKSSHSNASGACRGPQPGRACALMGRAPGSPAGMEPAGRRTACGGAERAFVESTRRPGLGRSARRTPRAAGSWDGRLGRARGVGAPARDGRAFVGRISRDRVGRAQDRRACGACRTILDGPFGAFA